MKWPEGSEPCATDAGLVASHDWSKWKAAYFNHTGERFYVRHCKGCGTADLRREDYIDGPTPRG